MNLLSLEQKIKDFDKEVNTTKGKLDLLKDQMKNNDNNLEEKKALSLTITKSVEILNLVSKSTKELIKNSFENIVSRGLQFIHQNDNYGFKLDFTKRGNLPELKFKVISDDMKEYHNIIDCNAGGSKDIISLALRQVLLEISKNKGILALDEPDKRLDKEELNIKTMEFIKEMQKETKRQVFLITHRKYAIESVDKPIIIN